MPISVKVGTTYKLVYKVWQKIAGTWVHIPSIHYKFGGAWKLVHTGLVPFIFTDTIVSNRLGYVMRTAAIAAGWNGTQPLQATVTINSGVLVGGVSAEGFAFSSGFSFPVGSSMKIINNGTIAGMGGKGADSSVLVFGDGRAGGDGGSGLFTNLPTVLVNNGTIYAGGGGGGTGQMFARVDYVERYRGGAGGGGRGHGTSLGGVSDTAIGEATDSQVWQSLATGGTMTTTGQSSWSDGSGGESGGFAYAGLGGVGGLLASSGQQGQLGEVSAITTPPNGGVIGNYRYSARGAGGAAGKAISGTANITYQTTGTIVGAID